MQHETSTLPSLAFAVNPFVGNKGAPFRVSNEDDEDEEDEELHDLCNNEYEMRKQNHAG